MRSAGHMARTGNWRGAYRVLVWKAEGKTLLKGHRRRCKDNTKTDLREVEWVGMDCIDLTRDRNS